MKIKSVLLLALIAMSTGVFGSGIFSDQNELNQADLKSLCDKTIEQVESYPSDRTYVVSEKNIIKSEMVNKAGIIYLAIIVGLYVVVTLSALVIFKLLK